MFDSPLYSLNKYIANILKTYIKDKELSSFPTTPKVLPDEIMVSFDVLSFHTNIFIIDMLKIITY